VANDVLHKGIGERTNEVLIVSKNKCIKASGPKEEIAKEIIEEIANEFIKMPQVERVVRK